MAQFYLRIHALPTSWSSKR